MGVLEGRRTEIGIIERYGNLTVVIVWKLLVCII